MTLWERLFVKGFEECYIENANLVFTKETIDDPIDGMPRDTIMVMHKGTVLAIDLGKENGISEIMSAILRYQGIIWVDDIPYDVDIRQSARSRHEEEWL